MRQVHLGSYLPPQVFHCEERTVTTVAPSSFLNVLYKAGTLQGPVGCSFFSHFPGYRSTMERTTKCTCHLQPRRESTLRRASKDRPNTYTQCVKMCFRLFTIYPAIHPTNLTLLTHGESPTRIRDATTYGAPNSSRILRIGCISTVAHPDQAASRQWEPQPGQPPAPASVPDNQNSSVIARSLA
jgi:hypothetical protein